MDNQDARSAIVPDNALSAFKPGQAHSTLVPGNADSSLRPGQAHIGCFAPPTPMVLWDVRLNLKDLALTLVRKHSWGVRKACLVLRKPYFVVRRPFTFLCSFSPLAVPLAQPIFTQEA